MNWFKAKLEVQGALKTPLASDTLWGHIAWSIALESGEEALEDFIKQYETDPPLILSHAFPEGFLPIPKLHGSVPEQKNLPYKKLLKLGYIQTELLAEPFNWETLLSRYEKQRQMISATQCTESRMRNSINRITFTVQSRALWSERFYIWKKKNVNSDDETSEVVTCMDLYCLSEWSNQEIANILSRALSFGYGGKTSIGYGNVKVKSVDPFSPPLGGNRMMALGCVATKPSSLPDLLSNVIVRYGKLGPIMAQRLQNPYKKPIVMFDAGSTCDPISRPFAGSVVKNVHTDSRIVTLGMAPLLTFTEA